MDSKANLPLFDGKQDALACWDLLDVVMGGAARRNADDIPADEWKRGNQRVFARLVFSLQSSTTTVIDEVAKGDGAALWIIFRA